MPTAPARPAVRRMTAAAVGVVVLLGAGCTAGSSGGGSGGAASARTGGSPTTSAPSPSAPPTDPSAPSTPSAGPSATSGDPSAVASAVDRLLTVRDDALASGDLAAFRATVADPASVRGRRQLAAFRAARALHAARVGHEVVSPVDDPGAVDVTVTYRVGGVDRADRRTRVRYAVARVGDRWKVVSEAPTGADPAPPWLAMPDLVVRRGPHAVVAGTADVPALRAAVTTVDRVLPALAEHWSGTPRRTLVLLPATEQEADALHGTSGPSVGDVAATTDGPTDARGLATGDRVVLDPDARRRLTRTGRDVVLSHELTHVAVRATVPGNAPTWLAEGYADHVGYAQADLRQRTLAGQLLDAVRKGTAPTSLPTADSLDPSVGDIEIGYLASWQVVETVVALRGEAAARRLVRACSSRQGEDAAERRCDAAMPTVLGIDRAQLTRDWQRRLDRLAG